MDVPEARLEEEVCGIVYMNYIISANEMLRLCERLGWKKSDNLYHWEEE